MPKSGKSINREISISTREIYHGKILSLRLDKVRSTSSGRETEREIVEHSQAVAIVPVDNNGNVILVRQFRKAAERELLEIPAGSIEEFEKPEIAARRELHEETGFTAGRLLPLGGFWNSPGFCTEYMYAFLALDLKVGQAEPDDDEAIEIESVSLGEIPDMIKAGKFQDAKSISCLLLVLNFYKNEL